MNIDNYLDTLVREEEIKNKINESFKQKFDEYEKEEANKLITELRRNDRRTEENELNHNIDYPPIENITHGILQGNSPAPIENPYDDISLENMF